MTRYAYVYVGSEAKRNFEIGMNGLIWGWKNPRYGPLASAATDWLEGPSQPTYLAFVQAVSPAVPIRGWPRTADGDLEPWRTAAYGAITISRVAGTMFRAATPVWPDALYEFRIRFDSVVPLGGFNGSRLRPEAVAAIRDSTLRRGVPILGPEPLLDDGALTERDVVAMLRAGASAEASEILDADEPNIGFDIPDRLLDGLDNLDGLARTVVRLEQRRLRRSRFGLRVRITCAICGRLLPVALVRLAHIKRRAEADRNERLTLANTMPACTLGCDELFERGYLTVSSSGIVTSNPKKQATDDLRQVVKDLAGRHLHGYQPDQEPFFAWHRTRHQ
jgi:hypothetical protein